MEWNKSNCHIRSLKMAKQLLEMSEFHQIMVQWYIPVKCSEYFRCKCINLNSAINYRYSLYLCKIQGSVIYSLSPKVIRTFFIVIVYVDYVEEIYQKLLSLDEDAIDGAFKELVDTTPTPMSDMFEKQSRDEALEKHEHRKELATKDIPPTAPGQLTLIGYCKITILITMF